MERLTDEERRELVEFCVQLVRTPSPPGEEGECARIVKAEMERLGFDEVWVDEAGNVLGLVKGSGEAEGSVMLNSHMDHVEPGDPREWSVDPFSGEIREGRIYGRGASDNKGGIATQVHSLGYLLRRGRRPAMDVYVAAVVQEEVGGTGTAYIFEKGEIKPSVVVLGEGTSNRIYLGHRGGVIAEVRFKGRSAHASTPEKGFNPIFPAAKFILALEERLGSLPVHPQLGRSTISPTICSTNTRESNVIPSMLTLTLDWRTTIEGKGYVVRFLRELADSVGAEVEIEIPIRRNVTYTGYRDREREAVVSGFVTPMDDPFVQAMRRAVAEVRGEEPEFGYWRFATDGRFSASMGITTFGFSPCEEELAHRPDESISIEKMEEAVLCYAWFLLHPASS